MARSGKRTGGRQLLVFFPAVALLFGMLNPLTTAAAAPAASDSDGQLRGQLAPASWHWAEKTPAGDAFRRLAPMIEVWLGKDGRAVWAPEWTIVGNASDVVLRFSGLPQGVTVSGAGFPAQIQPERRGKVTDCGAVGDAIECRVRVPKSGSMSQVVSPVILVGSTAVSLGDHDVRVELLADGKSVSGVSEAAAAAFTLHALKRTPTEFLVERVGQPLVTAEQPNVHRLSAYRLSGPNRNRGGVFRVSQAVHKKLRTGVELRGRGWSCHGSSCQIRTQVSVGSRLPGLGLLWQIQNRHVEAWPKAAEAKAHEARWWSRYTFNDRSQGRLRRQVALIRHVKPPEPEYKNSNQVLAPVKRAQVSVRVVRHGPARLRGTGTYQVHVTNGGSRAANSLRVQLRPPSHATIRHVTAPRQWRCKGTQCHWNGKVRTKQTLPPLIVALTSSRRAQARQAGDQFVAVASWTAKGQRGRQHHSGNEATAWAKPLKVQATATNTVVHSASGVKTQLVAAVSNVGDGQVTYAWKQLCSSGCPKVSWVGPRGGAVGDDAGNARFTPPSVKRKTKLTFRVTAEGDGARATDQVSVLVLPVAGKADQRWDPRVGATAPDSTQDISTRLNQRRDPNTYQPLDAKAVATARVNRKGPTTVDPGNRVRLRLRKLRLAKQADLKKVTWSLNGRNSGRMKRFAASTRGGGQVLSFRVPGKHVKPIVATAHVELTGKRRVDVGEIVQVVRSNPSTPSTSASTSGSSRGADIPETAAAAAAPAGAGSVGGGSDGGAVVSAGSFSGATFCDFFKSLAEGDTFTIGSVTLTASAVASAGSGCSATGASLTVAVDPVTVNGVTLSGLSLLLTSSSLTLTVGSVTLPTDATGTAAAITVSGTLTASWGSSGPTGFSGKVTASGLAALPYLSLPDDWSVASAVFTVDASASGASFTLNVTATGANGGQATLTGDIDTDGSFSIDVAVHNALTLTGYDGSAAVFGGSGSLARSAKGAFTYSIKAAMTTESFELLDDVSLGSASLSWSNAGFNLSGSVTTTIGSESVAFTVTASVTSFSDWTATITATATPSLAGLPLTSLSGTFGYAKSAFTFDVTVSVSVADVSSFLDLTVSDASASILNSCPTGDSTCSTSQIRLELQVSGSVALFSDTIDFSTTVDVDISTGEFNADFSLSGADFGPAEAQLDNVSFFVEDDGAAILKNNPCVSATTQTSPSPSSSSSSSSTSSPNTVYGFQATATILGDVTFSVTGVYQGGTASNPSGSGYCFYGTLETSSISALDSLGLSGSLNFLYSSYATTADGQAISAESPTMWATIDLPSQVKTFIGDSVQSFSVFIELITSGGSVTGLKVAGSVEMSAYIAGSATSLPSFELTSIGLALQVSTGTNTSVEVSFDCDGVLTTPGNGAGTMSQSVMDFDASIGLTVSTGSDGGSLNLTANLASVDGAANAFGVTGLYIGSLGISMHIGFDALVNSSFTISGSDIELPGNIAGPIGLSSTAPITFSLTIGITAPCFDLAIGTPDQTSDAAIDWGGVGVLEAYYLHFLLAPDGNCTMADGTKIAGNFAFAFDGYILGVETDINIEVSIDPLIVKGSIDIDAFNLAGVDLKQTTIDIDFDPSAEQFDLAFKGGLNAWGEITINVSGTVDVDLSASNPTLDIAFDGSLDANLFGLFTSDITVDVAVDASKTSGTFNLNTLDIHLAGSVKVLVFEADASFTLDYSGGNITTLSGSVGVNLNLYVIDFGVELAFSYDPAATGNQDLAITITGTMSIDLWLFTINVSVSITIDIDASFLSSNEYKPQPVQQVNAPTSLVSGNQNTDPNTWTYNSGMYTANNFGWLANLVSNYQAVSDAAGASTVNSTNDAFDQIWNAGYLTGGLDWPQSGTEPVSIDWIDTNSWPGAYPMSLQTTSFSVVPTKGVGTIGNDTSSLSTKSEIEVTATLPPSTMASDWSDLVYVAGENAGRSVSLPTNPNKCFTDTVTKTWTVQIPDVANGSPGNWAWVMMDTNWRLFGSTLRENANTLLNGFDDGLPDYSSWKSEASDSLGQLFNTTGPVPLQPASGFEYNCGYEDFATQQSLHDFMAEQGIPWHEMPPPITPFDANYTSSGGLQPGWGAGWQPYDLTGTQYGVAEAYSVEVNGGYQPNYSPEYYFPCSPGQVDVTSVDGSGSLWSSTGGEPAKLSGGNYLQVETSGNSSHPWVLRLYNSEGQELRSNGIDPWIPEPSGGWPSGYSSFTVAGNLFAADQSGVIFQASDYFSDPDKVWTYLGFTGDNPITQQFKDGVSAPTLQYAPVGVLNDCAGDNPAASYQNPNDPQVTTPTTSPSYPSLTTRSYGGQQVFYPAGGVFPSCSAGAPESRSVELENGSWTVSSGQGEPVDLLATNRSLRLAEDDGAWSLHLYGADGKELRWDESEPAWVTEPGGGWATLEPFATDVTLSGASPTGVQANYSYSDAYEQDQPWALWFYVSPANPMAAAIEANQGGSATYTTTYTPDPGLNSCTTGTAVYSGS
ncbi:MAG: hypothetical protein KDC39_00555 [Actinobacteria bacterium]|nr:hypothetical protein [Actinomycetota bacterium]